MHFQAETQEMDLVCLWYVTLLLLVKSAVGDAGAFASAVHTEWLTYSQAARTWHVISMTL